MSFLAQSKNLFCLSTFRSFMRKDHRWKIHSKLKFTKNWMKFFVCSFFRSVLFLDKFNVSSFINSCDHPSENTRYFCWLKIENTHSSSRAVAMHKKTLLLIKTTTAMNIGRPSNALSLRSLFFFHVCHRPEEVNCAELISIIIAWNSFEWLWRAFGSASTTMSHSFVGLLFLLFCVSIS